MWDTIKKMEYRAQAKLPGAAEELEARLSDRMELPLQGLSGEKLYLTGMTQLRKAEELEIMYQALPEHRGERIRSCWMPDPLPQLRALVLRCSGAQKLR